MAVTMKALAMIAICLGMVAGKNLQIPNAGMVADEILNDKDNYLYPDCHSLFKAGYIKNGTYRLTLEGDEFLAPCEFRDGWGFTIFLNRVDGYVDWGKTYKEYQLGFGYQTHDYFSGLNRLSQLTKANTVLYTTVMDWDNVVKYSENHGFSVGDSYSGYRFSVNGFYRGNLVNDLAYNNGRQFHTMDNPDRDGCAHIMRGGWWYNRCSLVFPTGHYYPYGPYHTNKTYGDGIFWVHDKGVLYSLKKLVMSVRPDVH